MPDITIAAPKHSLAAYLSIPEGAGPWPGIVVLHDILGQTTDSRRHTDHFAAHGYIALAPDLYSRGLKPTLHPGHDPQHDRSHRSRLRRYRSRTRHPRKPHRLHRCTIGVIGFCMGGGFALLLAANNRGFSAASVNYGQVPKDAETLLQTACPIIGSFGARDRTLKGAAARLETALSHNGIDHDIREYPDAAHAFLDQHAGLAGWIMARIGSGYHAASAADAETRILAFFGRHLR